VGGREREEGVAKSGAKGQASKEGFYFIIARFPGTARRVQVRQVDGLAARQATAAEKNFLLIILFNFFAVCSNRLGSVDNWSIEYGRCDICIEIVKHS
jgi:hypothetical protein